MTRELEEQVSLLRAAVSALEDVQAADKTSKELAELNARVELMAADINRQLAEMGNGETGTLDVLSALMKTVESLGSVVEGLHRERHLKNDVIESLLSKLSMEKTWQSVAVMWQNYAVAHALKADERTCSACADRLESDDAGE